MGEIGGEACLGLGDVALAVVDQTEVLVDPGVLLLAGQIVGQEVEQASVVGLAFLIEPRRGQEVEARVVFGRDRRRSRDLLGLDHRRRNHGRRRWWWRWWRSLDRERERRGLDLGLDPVEVDDRRERGGR